METSVETQLPTVLDVRKRMRRLSFELYRAWKRELGNRILDLELDSCIAQEHLCVDSAVWRLPNTEVRYALGLLQTDLETEGYDCSFRFIDIDNVTWSLSYVINLPERFDEEEITNEILADIEKETETKLNNHCIQDDSSVDAIMDELSA